MPLYASIVEGNGGEKIIKKIKEIMEERAEKEGSKDNLVIFYIEDETLNKRDQAEQDLIKCKDLFVN